MDKEYSTPFSLKSLIVGNFIEVLPYILGVGAFGLILYFLN